MYIDRPELEKEAGGDGKKRDETEQSAKGYRNPIIRERKVLQDECAPVLDAGGVGPCVTVRTVIVATCKFVDGRCPEAVELDRTRVNIRIAIEKPKPTK